MRVNHEVELIITRLSKTEPKSLNMGSSDKQHRHYDSIDTVTIERLAQLIGNLPGNMTALALFESDFQYVFLFKILKADMIDYWTIIRRCLETEQQWRLICSMIYTGNLYTFFFYRMIAVDLPTVVLVAPPQLPPPPQQPPPPPRHRVPPAHGPPSPVWSSTSVWSVLSSSSCRRPVGTSGTLSCRTETETSWKESSAPNLWVLFVFPSPGKDAVLLSQVPFNLPKFLSIFHNISRSFVVLLVVYKPVYLYQQLMDCNHFLALFFYSQNSFLSSYHRQLRRGAGDRTSSSALTPPQSASVTPPPSSVTPGLSRSTSVTSFNDPAYIRLVQAFVAKVLR